MFSGRRRLDQPARAPYVSAGAPLLVRITLAFGVLAASLSGAAPARADAVDEARAAYQRGAEAFSQKRYKEAAKEFARADELSPNAVTLQQALRAAAKSDDPGIAMDLADRAEKRGGDEALVKAGQALRETFAPRAGKLSIQCADARPCTARVDASIVTVGAHRWVSAGDHQVEIDADGKSSSYTVTVAAGGTLDWRPIGPSSAEPSPAPPAPPSASAPPSSSAPKAPAPPPSEPQEPGISSAWFWLGLGVTASIGAATAYSGLDTLNKHDLFVNGNDGIEAEGRTAQLRTNVLLATALVIGAGTTALGIVTFTQKAPAKGAAASASLAISPSGAALRVRY